MPRQAGCPRVPRKIDGRAHLLAHRLRQIFLALLILRENPDHERASVCGVSRSQSASAAEAEATARSQSAAEPRLIVAKGRSVEGSITSRSFSQSGQPTALRCRTALISRSSLPDWTAQGWNCSCDGKSKQVWLASNELRCGLLVVSRSDQALDCSKTRR